MATELARAKRIEAKKKLIAAVKAAEDLKRKYAEKEKEMAEEALKEAEDKAKELEEIRFAKEKLAEEKKAKAAAAALELEAAKARAEQQRASELSRLAAIQKAADE